MRRIYYSVFGGECWNGKGWFNSKPRIWNSVGWVDARTLAHALRQWNRVKPYWRKGSQLEINSLGDRKVLRARDRITGNEWILK